jgi:hypothetical protein
MEQLRLVVKQQVIKHIGLIRVVVKHIRLIRLVVKQLKLIIKQLVKQQLIRLIKLIKLVNEQLIFQLDNIQLFLNIYRLVHTLEVY